MLYRPQSILFIAMFINGDIDREWKIETYIKLKWKAGKAVLDKIRGKSVVDLASADVVYLLCQTMSVVELCFLPPN